MAATAPDFLTREVVLSDLLHSVSQPITTLHCALEHSLELDDASHSEDVCLALEQTGRVIEAVRLMREYLDAEQSSRCALPTPAGLAVEEVLQQLSVVTEARGMRLFAYGSTKALVPVAKPWLERALCYLVGTLIESAQFGATIVVLLEDHTEQSVVSGCCLSARASLDLSRPVPFSNSLRQARLAIAQRVLESSDASVECYSGEKPGFVVRLAKSGPVLKVLSA
jgi:hypothetical protein